MTGTRTTIYLHHDPDGHVEDYVLLALRSLRALSDHVLVVVNGALTPRGRERLSAVADDVLVRENTGLDVGGYQAGLSHLGWERVARLDSLLLTNNTYLAPLAPWEPVLRKADARPEASFWGLTEHAETRPHPFLARTCMPRHLQSHFLVIRPRLLQDPALRTYWETMPAITSYNDSVAHHESRFTAHFNALGHESFAVYPLERYRGANPSLDDAATLLDDGCPVLKRRLFFHEPSYLDGQGVDAPGLLRRAVALGYPEDTLLSGLARTSEPRTLLVNAGLTHLLGACPPGPVGEPTRWAGGRVHALVSSPAQAERAVRLVASLPTPDDVVLACTDQPTLDALAGHARDLPVPAPRLVLASRPALGALGSLLLDAPELLDDDAPLLRLALGPAAAQADPLADSPEALAAALRVFDEHPTTGLVLPVAPVTGSSVHGHGWGAWRPFTAALARRAGLSAPLDQDTPLSAYGRSSLLRPHCLRPLLDPVRALAHPAAPGAAQALEHVVACAVLSAGLHCRQVLTDADAASFALLEHRYQRLAALLPPGPAEQAPYLAARSGPQASPLAVLRRGLEHRAPAVASALTPTYRTVQRAGSAVSGVLGRLRPGR